MHAESTVLLQRLEALAYRSTSGTRANRRRRFTSALVMINGQTADGTDVRGLGEAQFRGWETRDGDGRSWTFLTESLELLQHRAIDCQDRGTALTSVQELMTELSQRAEQITKEHQPKLRPNRRSARRVAIRAAEGAGLIERSAAFAGTLFGIETALLDVAARALGVSVAALLSDQRAEVPVLPPIQMGSGGRTEFVEDLVAAGEHTPAGSPIWLDFQRKLSYGAALRRVQEIVAAANRGEVEHEVVIRRPLRRRDLHRRAEFTWAVRKLAANEPRLRRVTIARDVIGSDRRVTAALLRPVENRVVEVRPAAAGGVLAAAQRLRTSRRSASERLYVVDVEAGGPVAFAALQQMAAATPGIAGVVADSGASSAPIEGPGLAVEIPWEEIVDAVTDRVSVPAEEEVVTGRQPNVYSEVPYLQPLGPNGTKGHMMERQALALGMSTIRFSKGAFLASDGVHDPLLFKWSRSPLSTASSLALCTHKEGTRLRLDRAGVPVPKGRTFRSGDFDTAREFADTLGYPVVVKPAMGVRGIGVVAGITDRTELDAAFEQMRSSKLGGQDFIVEKHIPGKDYRIVVIGDEVVAAILRDPASVLGDGQHNVAELIIRKNATRRLNPHLWGRPILYGTAARYQLAREGLTLESVPAAGRRMLLSNSCSLSQGGDSVDVLDELHPSIRQACVAAVKAIPGLAFCGVDFLLEDHRKPLSEQTAGICELNAHAAIGNCEYPTYGTPREVARTFMDACVQHYDLQVPEQRKQHLSLRLTVRGRVIGVGYRAWMRRHAETYGLTGWIRNVGRRSVEVVLSGETVAASALAAAAVLGPSRSRPTSVTTEHVETPTVSGFSVVQRAPQELTSVR